MVVPRLARRLLELQDDNQRRTTMVPFRGEMGTHPKRMSPCKLYGDLLKFDIEAVLSFTRDRRQSDRPNLDATFLR